MLFVGAERDRLAARPGPPGAADAMNVGFRVERQVVVDDVRDVVHVQSARRDVAGHQHARLAVLESLQRPRSLLLGFVRVNDLGRYMGESQPLGHAVGPALGPREYQRLGQLRVLQQLVQQLGLQRLGDEVKRLLHGVGRRRLGRHADLHRVGEDLAGHRLDFLRHGRREHQRLPLPGDQGDHAPDIVDESHVQHAVGLVQDEDLDLADAQDALVDQVEQPPRRGDEDIHALPDRLDLRMLADAAENDRVPQSGELAVNAEALVNLGGQLAGGRQDQRANGRAGRSVRVGGLRAGGGVGRPASNVAGKLAVRCALRGGPAVKQLQYGQRERCRLAGARLSAAQQVPALQHVRDRFPLDGGGNRVTLRPHRAQQRLDELESLEWHGFSLTLFTGNRQHAARKRLCAGAAERLDSQRCRGDSQRKRLKTG